MRLAPEALRAIISFDPNLRPPLWENLAEAKKQMEFGLSKCDVLKIADNELEFVTGQKDFYKGAEMLKKAYPNIRILNITAGAEGSLSFYGEEEPVFVPAYQLGGTIETTGAGDTFCACVLNFILENGTEHLTVEQRKDMLCFANAAAYLVTTKKGALRAMPKRNEIEEILTSR